MGTKRVGWARIKSLINENQNSLKMRKRVTKAAAASSTTTLTAADSGKVILLAPNAAVVNLPSPEVGLHFEIVSTGAFDTTKSEVRTDAGTTFFIGGHSAKNGGNCATPGATDDRAEFLTGTSAGDSILLICVSTTEWMVRGLASTSTSITYTDGGS